MLQRAAVLPGGCRANPPSGRADGGVAFFVAKPEEDEGLAGAQRRAAPYLDAVWQMVAALVAGALVGMLLDRKLGSGPWGVVSGLGLGLGLGFWRLVRTLSSLGRQP